MKTDARTLCTNEECAKRFDCFRYLQYASKANQSLGVQKFKPNKQGDCWVFLRKKDDEPAKG